METGESNQIERYLQKRFANNTIKARPRSDDVAESSAEISVGGEFVGVVFKDNEDGEVFIIFK